jgi:zinc/manganese transport system substrate-binding protein
VAVDKRTRGRRHAPHFAAVLLAAALVALGSGRSAPASDKIAIVAAENMYGDIAAQIGGGNVTVSSLIANPAQDPHLFEASPSAVRRIADAQVVIVNGVNYDPWIDKLLQSNPNPKRIVISAAKLMGRKPGDNPHLWYDPATMPRVAEAITATLTAADPAHATDFATNLNTLLGSLERIDTRIAALRGKYQGTPVTATEPVFGPMAQALGLTMRNERFQIAVMNDTEPSAHDLAEIERDLKERKVKVLFYNSQVSEALVTRLRDLAKASNIPVVGVTETLPAGQHFQNWMLSELDATEKALGGK